MGDGQTDEWSHPARTQGKNLKIYPRSEKQSHKKA
ncbi:hypothetical protein SAMN02746065_11211 [Desulfocicer vacuolatum DSM 3385]|uniref:Uncharacterized protein n=1 Tax=Desulfocicer vacuolatum DSM 3385 TaxID=1121400 RepID=A0A1W2CEH2_9BACT|nr:hypothetical protein SAMN02746065_11211 [Desulfocicer vacuolatum DSM 3385]